MKMFENSQNRWAKYRMLGSVALVLVALWTVLAAALRSFGEIALLQWTGYQAFDIVDGVELAVIPLVVVLAAGWLEQHDLRVEAERSQHHEAEQSAAEHRKEVIKRLHDAVLAELPEHKHSAAEKIGEQTRLRLKDLIQAALAELDGKGKGEVLHFLYEKGLLNGHHPAAALNGTDLRGAWLEKAHLKGIWLEHADLRGARMQSAHLASGRLSGANLNKALLRHADLRDAVLIGSNLMGAHLENANLEGADLSGAFLKDAFLIHASLKNSTVNDYSAGSAPSGPPGIPSALDQAVLIETICPDGRKVTNEKGKEYLRKKEIAALIDKL